MKLGIHNISDEQYFADPGINASGLKKINQSPAHYWYNQLNPKDPTKGMIAGSACHCAILEPDDFADRYAILPDNAPARPTKAMLDAYERGSKQQENSIYRIEFWKQFDETAEGRHILTPDEAAEYLHIGVIIRNHPELQLLFDDGLPERALFATDPETEVRVKCKPDLLTQLKHWSIMLELKSTDDARPHVFQHAAFKFDYFMAAAFYMDVAEWCGYGRPDVYWIAAFERTAPYGVKIYEVPPAALEFGQRRYRKALDTYAQCLDTNTWPNYDTTIDVLTLPTWAKE
jgi:exodeoxyribonuclease VIII